MAGDSSDLPRFITGEGRILPGVRRVVTVPGIALGAEWSVVVPGGVYWRILGGEVVLSTSAAVGNRNPDFIVFSAGVRTWRYKTALTVTASEFATWVLRDGALPGAGEQSNLTTDIGVPTIWLGPQDTFGTENTNLQAGDQFTVKGLLIEELYATNEVLSEWHEREMEAYRAAIT